MHLPIYLLPIAGLAIGFLISLLGGGGGIFYVGLLTGLFAISIDQAVSISLATIIPTTLAASISHYRAGNIQPKIGFLLVAGGIIGVTIGSYFVTIIPIKVLKITFGIFLLVMGFKMMFNGKKTTKNTESKDFEATSSSTPHLQIIKGLGFGLLGGLMSGMLGVSGTPPIIAGLYSLGLSSFNVVGTSVMVLFFIALTGVITHSAFGTMNWFIVFLLASGTITGAILGPFVGRRINHKTLDKFYGPFFVIFIFLMALTMFF
ncbi:sulfite exporter TauE/SafE family protein [Clostridium sporogenes]|uniref:sulfite exporter TauE/SafE family protein n=1 Tax=Clostridium sporogenes TaxID=1509 RepID=UPI00313B6FCB